MIRSILAASVLLVTCSALADSKLFTIVDDEAIEEAVHSAREQFLKRVDFDRLDATLLVRNADGTWRRGSHNPDALAYPASSVKLAYLAAAMQWSGENDLPYDHLDSALRPMIVDSSNIQTGVTVDALSGVENLPDMEDAHDPRYEEWVHKRLYTARFLEERGLLGDQVIIHKTYPTNSGRTPVGAEKVTRETLGMNMMSPALSASLMLEIAKGAGYHEDATAYMHGILDHNRWLGNSVIGTGVPPGSLHLNKPGYAYSDLVDIAYVKMPNEQEFVLAIYTNGWMDPYRKEGKPYRTSILGMFAEDLIERAGLNEGNPPRRRIDNEDKGFTADGNWTKGTDPTQWGSSHLLLEEGEGSATWHLAVPEDGRYEICVLYPRLGGLSRKASYSVRHDRGEDAITVDQSIRGGQWVRLGDYHFAEGGGAIVLQAGGEPIAADAVRAIKWPETSE